VSIEDIFDFAAGAVTGALGDEVTWKPGTASEATIKGVYGRGFDRVQSGNIRLSSNRPELMVRASDLDSDPVEGDELEVRGITFEVVTPKLDVENVSWTLVLKRSS